MQDEDRKNEQREEVASALSKVLSLHGHGFHYAVMRCAEDLSNARKSHWVHEATEFPVVIRDQVTHVDFILRSQRGHTYLVAECKRVDPARARWCFLPAPYTWKNKRGSELIFEEINNRSSVAQARAKVLNTSGAPCNIGIELRTNHKGDGRTESGRSPINDAAAQVLRGTSGLINRMFGESRGGFQSPPFARFLPVVFTTAELWVSGVDLGSADRATGRISTTDAERMDWVWFNHNQSPALQHDVERADVSSDLSTALRQQHCRTIAVVGSGGIESFLSRDLEDWMDD